MTRQLILSPSSIWVLPEFDQQSQNTRTVCQKYKFKAQVINYMTWTISKWSHVFFLYRNIIKCCKKSMTIWSQVLKNRKSGTITFNGFLNTHGAKPTPPNRVPYFRNNISVSTFRITRMISSSRRDQQCLISNRSFLEIWLTSMWMMYNMATRLEFAKSLAA